MAKITLNRMQLEVLPHFLAEAADAIVAMESAVLRLEEGEAGEEPVNEIFRVVHTLKGDFGSLGFPRLASLCHRLENALDVLRASHASPGARGVSLLLLAVDGLQRALRLAERHEDELDRLHQHLVVEIEAWGAALAGRAGGEQGGPAATADQGAPEAESGAPDNRSRYLRVDVERLDLLLNLVGEISVGRGTLGEAIQDVRVARGELIERHRDGDLLYQELQELVLKLRMVPVGPAFQRHVRLVRDLGERLGKPVRLRLEGGDVELDSSVLQLLQDPLAHMLRNAMVHGIEPAEERTSRGKAPVGEIQLRTAQEGGSLSIVLRDDGRGIDGERVVQRAKDRGLVAESAVLSHAEMLELLFLPGFSTATEVSDLAGRGVGMDVVRRNIEALRGSMEISSTAGEGSAMRIRLPLTLAIVDGLIVRAGAQLYVVSVDEVGELLDLGSGVAAEADGLLYLRGRSLPCLRLSHELGVAGAGRVSRETAVIRRLAESSVALVVDGVLGKTQVVIKPLPKALEGTAALAGTTILGSGRIAMVLDLASLVRRRQERTAAPVVN